jgi:hypothetical protein
MALNIAAVVGQFKANVAAALVAESLESSKR